MSLQEGFAGPAPYTFRLARPGEGRAVAGLLELAGVEVEPEMVQGIDSGQVSGDVTLRSLTSREDGMLAMAEYMTSGNLAAAVPASYLVLVATHPDEADPVGVVTTNPPGSVMQQLMDTVPGKAGEQAVMMLLLGIKKLAGVAVQPEHRRTGLGRLLTLQAVDVAHRTRASHVYGQTRTQDHLVGWYQRCGFQVLPPGEGLDLSWLVDFPFGISPMPGEQLFLSTQNRPARLM